VDDLDDLLARRQALGQVGADQLVTHPPDEIPDHPQVDVGLEQG